MQYTVCFIMDPIDSLDMTKDTTVSMYSEADRRYWKVDYAEITDLYYESDDVFVLALPLQDGYIKEIKRLADYDIVFMRKDPPFNMNYIYATYLLEKAEKSGTWVINRPSSLRDCNEKFFTTYFPECCPPMLVSSFNGIIRDFIEVHTECIIKPLDSMGGSQVFKVHNKDINLSVMLEMLTHNFTTPIMVQTYIPAIKNGDKRILMINGKPFPYALNRIPKEGELRGNLAAGAVGEVLKINERDQWICEQIAPSLIEKGLLFVGIDIIGEYLTEINVTSPTGAQEIAAECDTHPCSVLFDFLEKQLAV